MTDDIAEKLVDTVLELRTNGIHDDEKIISELKKTFSATDDDFHWIIEMINTGGFRASIVSSGKKYPKTNLNIEDDPVLKASFKKYWIELKGEQDYINNYLNKKKWWYFW